MKSYSTHVYEEKHQEEQKVLVVFVTKAVIYKIAVVIELLNASVTEITVGSVLWPEVFTVNTHVIKVELFI